MQPDDAAVEMAVTVLLQAIESGKTDHVATLLAGKVIPQFLPAATARRYFQLWEEHGFHITRNHFYSPLPDTRLLGEDTRRRVSELPGVDPNEAGQLRLLREVFPRFAGEYGRFPLEPTGDPAAFYFNNGQFGGVDALVLYCMVRHYRPTTIVEVGSGYSTRVASRAAVRNGATSIICIEPYPEAIIPTLPAVDRLISSPVQEVDLGLFEALGPNDILFIDSTHVVRTGGDVPFLYLEVLPRLQPGVIVHLHDIFLPGDYPRNWLTEHHLFWNEQYLLHGFLLFNATFEVLFGNNYMRLRHGRELRAAFPGAPEIEPGSFWMRRKA